MGGGDTVVLVAEAKRRVFNYNASRKRAVNRGLSHPHIVSKSLSGNFAGLSPSQGKKTDFNLQGS